MKKTIKAHVDSLGVFIACILVALALAFTVNHAFAADPSPAAAQSVVSAPTAAPDLSPAVNAQAAGDSNALLAWFLSFAGAHPWVATILGIMAFCRAWAKPASSLIHAIVDLTPSKVDDGIFNAVLLWFNGPIGSKVAYLIDYVTSIKIVPPAKPTV